MGESRIQLETSGKKFKIERGVRKGDSLSPKLFSAALENIFHKLDLDNFGLNKQSAQLNHLRFTDDIFLFEENPTHLKKMIELLNGEKQQKWRWTSHIIRDSQEKWSKSVTNWYPRDGKRNRGRQQTRREDDLKLTAGHQWRKVARDRTQWKLLEEAYGKRHNEL
ncbi:hypothetical protein EVAR_93881_1 [Eumeta japonica]|uniref:Reverse transcriptase domain-containing protein n=1 Tax=Eumeta variegata TaxID=151549 RepID=A0A4C1TXZ1_EUMVA|nr:hypothetical protein EVAR_93881_1 [Eumeta japonica]